MHILILDPSHLFDFTAVGHKETRLPLTALDTPLPDILALLDTPPDCIIQQESLDERHFVSGLEHAPCPTFFFSFDTHLNLFWHQRYARLFDAVLTPHPSLFAALPDDDALPHVFRLPHAGYAIPWTPHARRQHECAFCGRTTGERPIRAGMLELVRNEFSLAFRDNLTTQEMLDLYADSRVAPNEAICFEVNCRLFEAASAGAAVLTQDCGPDQSAVFADGKETLIYMDGLDLLDKARWLRDNPDQAERIGRAARDRVQREHLPVHRAATVLELLPRVSQARAGGRNAALFMWLTLVERATSGDMRVPATALLRQSETLPQTPAMLAALLRLLGKPSRRDEALAVCLSLLESGLFPDSGRCNAVASAAALRHGSFPLASAFWRRYAVSSDHPSAEPDNAFALCLAWAENERRQGRAVRPGFPFRPGSGLLPACALEFLFFAKEMEAQYALEGCDAHETIIALLADYPPYSAYRLRLLEHSCAGRHSWRRSLETAALALRCCRVTDGQRAFLQARNDAERCGEHAAFSAALAASPARAYTRLMP